MTDPIVIFLDFDGVLHKFGEDALDDEFRLLPNPNLFCWRGILAEALRPWPEVKIVISSDWARLFSDENLARLIGPELGERMIGVVETRAADRAREVLKDAQRRGLSRWLALDDHDSVREHAEAGDARFIHCDPELGVSDPRVLLALRAELGKWEKPKYKLEALLAEMPPGEMLPRLEGWDDMPPVGREVL